MTSALRPEIKRSTGKDQGNNDPRFHSLNSKTPLPPVEGPKLHQFPHLDEPIEFIELLRSGQDELSSSHGHAHVFKVQIKETSYALKVFKFFDVEQARTDILPFSNATVDNLTMTFHCDPFFAECRAYGRIEEIQKMRQGTSKKRVSDIAVPCFGFLGLSTPIYESFLKEKFAITDWNRKQSDYKRPSHKREPFRALVKELIETQDAITDPQKMVRDLIRLRAGGIYQSDIKAENYLGGLLVDFSVAWTTPHWAFQVLPEPVLNYYKDEELWDFDNMMEEAQIEAKVKATKIFERTYTLRPRKLIVRYK